MSLEEFRLRIDADPGDPNLWSVSVEDCAIDEVRGSSGRTALKVTSQQLSRLRNSTAPPDYAALKQLGEAVLGTIFTPELDLGFRLCLNKAIQNQGPGLRLVVLINGGVPTTEGIKPDELPLEAVFGNQYSFLSTNIKTPVSRGTSARPDRDPVKVAPPLRILVVASEPAGMPPVNSAAETAGILKALDPLIKSRAVVVEFCQPPSLMRLDAMLQGGGYHVVHFIGHGDFEVAGDDPSPQPHLYFEDGTANRWRQPADVEQLFPVLRNGNVPLVVLTACSSAASQPNGGNYPVVAFESLARALVERPSGPSAAVAMQFDLETTAAEVFSGALYSKLLTRGWSLDQAVSSARSALISRFGAGHRSWVNPTIYWRCKQGRVFELLDTEGDLTPEQRKEITEIDAIIEEYKSMLKDLSAQLDDLSKPPEVRAALAGLRAPYQAKIQNLMTSRGLTLGDTVRLRGGTAKPDGSIVCSLTLQLRLPATIGDVRAVIQYNPSEFDYIGHADGQHAPAGSLFPPNNTGAQGLVVLAQNVSQGVVWQPSEYELAKLEFRLKKPNAQPLNPLFYISLVSANVNHNGVQQQFRTLNAAIFEG